MANKTVAQVCILVLIIFSTFFVTLQARSLNDHVHKKVDSQRLLHELGIDLSKHIHIRVDDIIPGRGDRSAPGGPDPEHNR